MICKNLELYFGDKSENRRFLENRRTLPKLSFVISNLVCKLYSCLYDGIMMNQR